MITNIKVGDIVKIPVFLDELYKLYDGEIMDINENMLDKRLECKVCFDELNIITFFSIETLSNWKKLNNLEELKG